MLNSNVDSVFLKYNLAKEKLATKFNSIYEGYVKMEIDSPIEHLKYRIKKIDSIEEKLKNDAIMRGEYFDDSMFLTKMDDLNDIVGVRIVCSFLDDMQKIIKIIEQDEELNIINIKDFVTNPKESGYRSYHLIVSVPVSIAGNQIIVKAEIQIRTIVMDMWASLEHKIWYKKDVVLSNEVSSLIASTADICSSMDLNLNNFFRNKNSNQRINSNINKLPKGRDYAISILKYEAALKSLEDKVNLLYKEYDLSGEVNPIEHIKSRIKPFDKIVSKLENKNNIYSVDNMESYVNDVAGLRIVCSFSSDLPTILDMFRNDHDLEIIEEQDFIKNPKESGYRGYHLLILVPICLKDGKHYRKVEVQIRTIAMEAWACVEHKLCYQKEVSDEVRDKLISYANQFREIDDSMDNIIRQVRELPKNNVKRLERKR